MLYSAKQLEQFSPFGYFSSFFAVFDRFFFLAVVRFLAYLDDVNGFFGVYLQ